MGQIEIAPGIVREVHHDEVNMVHGELSKIDRAALKLQKIAPLRDPRQIFSRVPVYLFDVGVNNAHAGKLSTDMRWMQHFLRVKEDVVAELLHAGNVPGME